MPGKAKGSPSYGWVVLGVLFIFGVVLFGLNLSFGLFFKSLETEFSLSRTATSSIQSTVMLIGGVFAFIGGWFLDRYGSRLVFSYMGVFTGLSLVLTSLVKSPWQLFFTYGLLLPMGTGSVFVAIMSTVLRWFKRNRGVALGIASSGIGLGTVVIAPFATYLISRFDWRMAYLVMGLIAWAIIIPLSTLLKREPAESVSSSVNASVSVQKNEELSFSLSKFSRTWRFWALMGMWFLVAACIFLIFTHLVPHITDIGFSPENAAAVLSLTGATATVGRVLMGVASDRLGSKLSVIVCAFLMTASMLWLIWSGELWMLYLFAVVYGIGFGGIGTCMAAMIGEAFGVRQIGVLLGVLNVAYGVGAAAGSVLGGLVFDFSTSYSVAFLLGALFSLMTAALTVPVRREVSVGS